ncbi:hypothetical protein ABW19_dt0205658 [Dactylella cylindrospora]|nr:hypothetical protein ABW19_dt0205658 [Dactylella cylindrospora]
MGTASEYASVGGSLRIKGSAGITKKKKKKKRQSAKSDLPQEDHTETISEPTAIHSRQPDEDPEEKLEDVTASGSEKGPLREPQLHREVTKTVAELKFEETRKKRLDQKLLKEAAKSHKERVEDFNKYLANLSEHHDM